MKPALLLGALLLGGLLAWQWLDWPPGTPGPPAPGDLARGPQGVADVPEAEDLLSLPPPIEDYASIAERPLFLPDRRPPPDEPEDDAEGAPSEPTDLAGTDLVSVVITPAVVSAWIRGPKEPNTIRLRLGDDYEGWTVQSIEPDQLVLERQGETNQLDLRDYENAPPPIPPTPLPRSREGRQGDRSAGDRERAGRGAEREPAARRTPKRGGTTTRGPEPAGAEDAAPNRGARQNRRARD